MIDALELKEYRARESQLAANRRYRARTKDVRLAENALYRAQGGEIGRLKANAANRKTYAKQAAAGHYKYGHGLKKVMLQGARSRAKVKGLPFDLTYEDFEIPAYCPILGMELISRRRLQDCSPSLDRIDNSKGYVKGNVIVVSLKANRIKSNATVEEIRKVADFYADLGADK
jgi:hypothetical protein